MKKLMYESPRFNCVLVGLESGLLASSTGAIVNPGANQPQNYPQVEDWQEPGTGFSNDLEL